MLALLLLLQDLNADYLKEVDAIRKDHAKRLFELTLETSKKERYTFARADLQKIVELDPDHAKAKELLEKLKDLPDRGRGTDKTYVEKKKKIRAEIVKKYESLAAKMLEGNLQGEADDAKKRADDVRTETDPEPALPAEELMLKRLNEIRTGLGLRPVELDERISRGCRLHCEYLVKNEGRPQVEGQGAHEEDPKLPGFTAEGKKAGHASEVGFSSIDRAVDGWIGTFLHRIPLLEPGLEKVGAGSAAGGKYGAVNCLDTHSAGRGTHDAKHPILAYPPDGAKDVELDFNGEGPDPIPKDAKRPTGYPITLTFFDEQKVTDVDATLATGGKEVACHISTPENPATTMFKDNKNTVCLLAKKPLEPATTYTVKIVAKVNAAKFEKSWSFTTK